MIEGVKIKQLQVFKDERGYLMELLRSDDIIFEKFGQVYLTVAYPGVIKGWHWHKKQNDFFVVVKGNAKVVLYDIRENSKTKGKVEEFIMGEKNPILLKIPSMVAHGFTPIGDNPCFLINCPTEVYNREKPDEERLPFNTDKIPYNWGENKRGG
jgi:dTDP-4-dehydrorhamnose 3,5-epimerase